MRSSLNRWLIMAGTVLVAAAGAPFAAAQAATPTITAAIPKVVFPNDKGTYDLEIRGTGLDPDSNGMWPELLIEGAPALVLCDATSKAGAKCVKVEKRGPDLLYSGIDLCDASGSNICYTGARKVSVQPAGGTASEPADVAFSSVGFYVPYFATGGAVIVLLALVYLVLRNGDLCRISNGSEVPLAKALLLDPDTSTYSLSEAAILCLDRGGDRRIHLSERGAVAGAGAVHLCRRAGQPAGHPADLGRHRRAGDRRYGRLLAARVPAISSRRSPI